MGLAAAILVLRACSSGSETVASTSTAGPTTTARPTASTTEPVVEAVEIGDEVVVYSQDFEGEAPIEWDDPRTAVTPHRRPDISRAVGQ